MEKADRLSRRLNWEVGVEKDNYHKWSLTRFVIDE